MPVLMTMNAQQLSQTIVMELVDRAVLVAGYVPWLKTINQCALLLKMDESGCSPSTISV